MKRSELREHIFRLIFAADFHPPQELEGQISLYLDENAIGEEYDRKYIEDKTKVIAARVQELDNLINKSSSGWKTGRMNKADLSILRLAVYEMKMDEDIPVSVAINEAVELAKKFGGDDSSSFVNGVLAKLAE